MEAAWIATLKMTDSTPEKENPDSGEDLRQILERARAGDRSAFDSIFTLHQRRVLTTSWRLLGRLEDAEDAAQEVFVRLFRSLHRFDTNRELTPWLYRMTVNVCHDLRRKRERLQALSIDQIFHDIMSPSDAEDEIYHSEQRRLIEQSLTTLTEKERSVIVLRDLEGLSTGEVARILGSSETTVRSQVSVARVKIKRFLDRKGILNRAGGGESDER
jgi:RNA polymerase sigma-70 factor, ECF subfamily